MNLFILSSLVEYCCCGTVTVAADVTINHVEAEDLGHTMMLNDPKYNSNPAVFLASSSSVNTVRIETKTYCFLLLSLRWNNFWKAPALVAYCCCGAVTVAADVTINHVEADDLGHTMMLNDPKNNSNPTVFISSFFREQLWVFPNGSHLHGMG